MIRAEHTINALQVEYERSQQLCLQRLAAAEELTTHMHLTYVHISRVSAGLLRFRRESGSNEPYNVSGGEC